MSPASRVFPVHPQTHRDLPWMPRSIPWEAAEKFREQARSNHYQTLEGLAERGGLSPEEIYFAHRGEKWN